MSRLSEAIDLIRSRTTSAGEWAASAVLRGRWRRGRPSNALEIPPEALQPRRDAPRVAGTITLEIRPDEFDRHARGAPDRESGGAGGVASRLRALPKWLRLVAAAGMMVAIVAGGALYLHHSLGYWQEPPPAEEVVAAAPPAEPERQLNLPEQPETPSEETINERKQAAVEALLRLGELTASGDPEESETAFKMVSFLSPDQPQALIGLAEIRMEKGNFAGAREALENCVHYHPDSAQAWFDLGLLSEVEGDLKAAEDAYARATQLDPEHADAHLCLGVLLGKRDDALGAAYHLREAVTANPRHDAARYNLVVAYSGLRGRVAAALRENAQKVLDETEDEEMKKALEELLAECASEQDDAQPDAAGAEGAQQQPAAEEADGQTDQGGQP